MLDLWWSELSSEWISQVEGNITATDDGCDYKAEVKENETWKETMGFAKI